MTAIELVELIPPYTRSMADPRPEHRVEPIYLGPRFVRTRSMGRWHRIRSAVRYGSRVCWHFWCGAGITDAARALAVNEPGTSVPVCGTCEGRAVGAGQVDNEGPNDLLFSPLALRLPRWCPGSRTELCEEVPDPRGWPRYGICLVCGSQERMSASGGPYNSHYGLKRHEMATILTFGCPLHAFQFLSKGPDGSLRCWTCSRQLLAPKKAAGDG